MSETAPIRVILADDHPVVRDGLAAIVNQQKDMRVVAEADDGDIAIALYEEHRPDVMVLDLRMPRRDGLSVVEEVLEKHPKARLLIMTTYDGDEDIFKSLSRGAKGYILKTPRGRKSSLPFAPSPQTSPIPPAPSPRRRCSAWRDPASRSASWMYCSSLAKAAATRTSAGACRSVKAPPSPM